MNRNLFWIAMIFVMASCSTAKKSAYIKVCEGFIFDLNDGTLNGVKPVWAQSEIKEWLPCYTSFIPDGTGGDCGGGILYANHDFYFYTYVHNYIQIGPGFKGQVSDSLLHQPREYVRQRLGGNVENEYSIKDTSVDFFPRDYGCIRVEYKDNKAHIIGAHYASCDEMGLCE